mgnify:FL=1
MGMQVDHICFAVKNLEDGIAYWNDVFGYTQKTAIVVNSRQLVRVVFLSLEGSILVKLIEPIQGNTSLLNFVKSGGGFHHLCYRCGDLKHTMAQLREKGLLTLQAPQPGEAFNNHDIAFLLARNGLRIELIDTDEKAGILDTKPNYLE